MRRHDHQHSHGGDEHGHGRSHGLVDDSVMRSREGVRAVSLALLVLGLTAAAQAVVFAASGSVALLADLIHNFGEAATAIPLGIAFALRSARAERWVGRAVVLPIFVSACVAGYEAVDRLIDPQAIDRLGALAPPACWALPATGGRLPSARAPGAGSTAQLWSPTARTPAPTRT